MDLQQNDVERTSNGIKQLIQQYKKSVSTVTELKALNALLSLELTNSKKHAAEILELSNTNDVLTINQQELIINLLPLKEQNYLLQKETTLLNEKLNNLQQKYDTDTTDLQKIANEQLENKCEQFQLIQAEHDMKYDELKTEMQRILGEKDEKIKILDNSLHKQRVENYNVKDTFHKFKEATNFEIYELQMKIKQTDENLRIAKAKTFSSGSSANVEATAFKRPSSGVKFVFDPLDVQKSTTKFRQQINKTALQVGNINLIGSSTSNSMSTAVSEANATINVSTVQLNENDKNINITDNIDNKPKKRKLFVPNDFSYLH